MKRALTILVMVVTLLSVLTLQSLAWSANINGTEYEFDFKEYSGADMTTAGYFNQNLNQTITGYSFANGWFTKTGNAIGGQIISKFSNGTAVQLNHTALFAFPNDYNPGSFYVNLASFSDDQGWSIEDRGATLNITAGDAANKVSADYAITTESVENNGYNLLRYTFSADNFEKVISVTKVVTTTTERITYTATLPLHFYSITYASGIRYFMEAQDIPEYFSLREFRSTITYAPEAFFSSPEAFAIGYDQGYVLGNEGGYADGYSQGVSVGQQMSYVDGYTDGYDIGYTEGEDEANREFRETYGNNEVFGNFFNGLGGAVWSFIDNCLSFELFPNITIGSVVLVFVGAAVVVFLLKLLIATKGGGM